MVSMTEQPRSRLAPAFEVLLNNASREDIEVAFRLVVAWMHGKAIMPEKPEMTLLNQLAKERGGR